MKKRINYRQEQHLWRRVHRQEAWVKQGKKCKYCGSRMERKKVTADHVVCQKDGGSDDPKNIVAACGLCNRAKGSMTVKQFQKILHDREFRGPVKLMIAGILTRVNKRADQAVRNIERYAR